MMLMIAGHLDSEVPLTRVICVALDSLPAVALSTSTMITTSTGSNEEVDSSSSESLQKPGNGLVHHHHSGVVMDIEAIKWCHPDQPSRPPEQAKELGDKESCDKQRNPLLPVIFVRYAMTGSDHEAIDHSAKELSDEGISQRRISCSLDEIQYVMSLLQEQEICVDEAYRNQWKEKSTLNGTVFQLSLLRPTLEPLFPHRTAQLKRQAHKERMMRLQAEEEMRKAELQMRRDKGELIDRVCCKLGCTEWALLQCSRCPNACYCRQKRK